MSFVAFNSFQRMVTNKKRVPARGGGGGQYTDIVDSRWRDVSRYNTGILIFNK